jgi:hypothetical protein
MVGPNWHTPVQSPHDPVLWACMTSTFVMNTKEDLDDLIKFAVQKDNAALIEKSYESKIPINKRIKYTYKGWMFLAEKRKYDYLGNCKILDSTRFCALNAIRLEEFHKHRYTFRKMKKTDPFPSS